MKNSKRTKLARIDYWTPYSHHLLGDRFVNLPNLWGYFNPNSKYPLFFLSVFQYVFLKESF